VVLAPCGRPAGGNGPRITSSVDDAAGEVRLVLADHPAMSHQTIYDVLKALTDAGLVRCVQPRQRAGLPHHPGSDEAAGLGVSHPCGRGPAPTLTRPNSVATWSSCVGSVRSSAHSAQRACYRIISACEQPTSGCGEHGWASRDAPRSRRLIRSR
jgi:hypothetical protein